MTMLVAIALSATVGTVSPISTGIASIARTAQRAATSALHAKSTTTAVALRQRGTAKGSEQRVQRKCLTPSCSRYAA